jgi:nucleotide-binding universal stress UspA family protein
MMASVQFGAQSGAQFGDGPVLVGVDFSPASDAVVEYAARLARTEGRPLHVIYVLPVVPEDSAPLLEVQEAELQQRVKTATRVMGKEGAEVKGVLAAGSAAQTLLARADAIHAACIVVGTAGLQSVDRFLLGSVAETVVRTSNHPVLVVGPQAAKARLGDLPWRHVLLACDAQHGVTAAARLAGGLAVRHHARLTIFYVKRDGLKNLSEEEFAAMEPMLTPEAWLAVQPQCLIRAGEPAQEIVRMAEDSAADLLVMSVRSGHEMQTHVRGGILAQVLRSVRCPVLVLRTQRQSHADRHEPAGIGCCIA